MHFYNSLSLSLSLLGSLASFLKPTLLVQSQGSDWIKLLPTLSTSDGGCQSPDQLWTMVLTWKISYCRRDSFGTCGKDDEDGTYLGRQESNLTLSYLFGTFAFLRGRLTADTEQSLFSPWAVSLRMRTRAFCIRRSPVQKPKEWRRNSQKLKKFECCILWTRRGRWSSMFFFRLFIFRHNGSSTFLAYLINKRCSRCTYKPRLYWAILFMQPERLKFVPLL